MRHSKRTTLTANDVDGALNLRNVEVSTILVVIAPILHVLNLQAFDRYFFYVCK